MYSVTCQCSGSNHAAVQGQTRHNPTILIVLSVDKIVNEVGFNSELLKLPKAVLFHLSLILNRVCAEKMEIGVNFVPETPNLARVVEMKALTEALSKAFPELTPDQYPWPHRPKGGQLGYGWSTPPQLPTCTSTAQEALDRIRRVAVPRLQSRTASHAEASCIEDGAQVGFVFHITQHCMLLLCMLLVIWTKQVMRKLNGKM